MVWSAYLNSARSALYSHCSLCTLILCAGTRDPLMHQCVAHTKVIAILLLTYPHVFEQDCRHFDAKPLTIIFRVAVASTPSSLSAEATNGEKC